MAEARSVRVLNVSVVGSAKLKERAKDSRIISQTISTCQRMSYGGQAALKQSDVPADKAEPIARS